MTRAAIRTTAAPLVASLLAVILAASPALAGSVTVQDPGNDGKWGAFGEIRELKVTHGEKRVKVKTTFDAEADLHDFFVRTPGQKKWRFVIEWTTEEATPAEMKWVYVYTRKGFPRFNDKCRAKTAAHNANTLTFSVPRKRLSVGKKKPARIRMRERTYSFASDSDWNDSTRYTRWVKKG